MIAFNHTFPPRYRANRRRSLYAWFKTKKICLSKVAIKVFDQKRSKFTHLLDGGKVWFLTPKLLPCKRLCFTGAQSLSDRISHGGALIRGIAANKATAKPKHFSCASCSREQIPRACCVVSTQCIRSSLDFFCLPLLSFPQDLPKQNLWRGR